MIMDQNNIESEITCHILGSFQNEDLCNYRLSKKEVMEYLEKCFGAKKQLADVLSDTTYYIRKEKVETLEKQVEDMREAIREAHTELSDFIEIINDSHGVAGWHLNGSIASWDEFEINPIATLAKLQPFLQ